MFVAAALAASGASGPVRIRNLSPAGAMIEGASLPPQGDRFELRRGASSVSGRVVWSGSGKAGLRFDGRVEVAEWMPGGHAGQQRVDQVFQQTKISPPVAEVAVPSAAHEDMLAPAQLRRIARALDALADEIADDGDAVAKFAVKLQALDIASQALRRMADRTA
jgi:hypothetical protein